MHPSLNAGDVCLAKYGHKVDKADYQLCKVVEAEKDAKKLVSTRGGKESLPYTFMKLKKLRQVVQR